MRRRRKNLHSSGDEKIGPLDNDDRACGEEDEEEEEEEEEEEDDDEEEEEEEIGRADGEGVIGLCDGTLRGESGRRGARIN